MQVKIEDSWKKVLSEIFEKDFFKRLVSFVRDEYQNHQIFPPGKKFSTHSSIVRLIL